MYKYNLNYYIYVELTDYGKELIIRENGYEYFKILVEGNKQENGLYKLQMHEFMRLLGKHLFNGCKMPCKPTIYFDNKEKKEQ